MTRPGACTVEARRPAALPVRPFPRRRRLAALALLAATALACTPAPDGVERRLFALGTRVEIEIEGAAGTDAEAALAEIETLLDRFERDYHAWNDGELAELNAALAAGRSLHVSPGLTQLLEEARRLSAASGRHFDPGVGALVELWGFPAGVDARQEPPPAARIEARLERDDSIGALEIDGNVVRSDSDTLVLDLGGIAKGEAVDRVLEILRAHSIERALVNAGGDVRVLGRRAERAWRVGIRAPRGDGVLGAVELRPGEAAFTSGDYEQFFMHDGRRMHHILSPVTGYPVEHTQAVTVLAGDGVTADAAATALLVAGPDAWRDVAAGLGIEAALRVDAGGRVAATPAMRDRLHPADGRRFDIMAPSDD